MIGWLYLCAVLGLGALVGALSGCGRLGRWLAWCTGVAGLALPLSAPADSPMLRLMVALGVGWVLVRSVEMGADNGAMPLGQRVWHALSIFDTRRVRAAPPSLGLRGLAGTIAFVGLAGAGLWVALELAAHLDGPLARPLRWLGAAVIVYGLVDAVRGSVTWLYGLVGRRVPPLHDTPILSRSVREFWAIRWNKGVAAWLKRFAYLPVARRWGGGAGTLAAFVASGLLHGYIIIVSGGPGSAGIMLAFFLAQVPLLWIERQVPALRRGGVAARVWTISAILLTSPLFSEPMLGVLEAAMSAG